jgi:hypothetical protein
MDIKVGITIANQSTWWIAGLSLPIKHISKADMSVRDVEVSGTIVRPSIDDDEVRQVLVSLFCQTIDLVDYIARGGLDILSYARGKYHFGCSI